MILDTCGPEPSQLLWVNVESRRAGDVAHDAEDHGLLRTPSNEYGAVRKLGREDCETHEWLPARTWFWCDRLGEYLGDMLVADKLSELLGV